MISKEEAVALIGERLEKQPRLVVALDGMSCSGKTTFARALAEKFSGAVVHMDDFFLPRDRFTEEMQTLPGGNIDRARFKTEVLEPLMAGRDFAYRAFSCSSQSLLPDPVPVTGRLILVEGATPCCRTGAPTTTWPSFCRCPRRNSRGGSSCATRPRAWCPSSPAGSQGRRATFPPAT